MTDNVFERKETKISKWTRFRLLFCRTFVSFDSTEHGEYACIVFSKHLKGETYITKTLYFANGNLVKIEKL